MAFLPSLLSRWALPVVWATLPLTAGPALAASLDPRSSLFRAVASIGLWALWALALAAALVPRAVTLVVVRVAFPASVVAVGWAALATPAPGAGDIVALACTAAAALLALAPTTGQRFVDGSSYGPERRLPLRPPGALLLGPIELAWAAVVVGATAGPLLLAAQAWVAGAIALVVGLPAAALAARALHGLAQRCVVFVPAGLVIVDPMSLTDALLMTKATLARIGPAEAGTTARDLTAGALGLALEASFTAPQTIVPAPGRRAPASGGLPPTVDVDRVLFSPSRPGQLLAEARDRGLPVG